MYRLVAPLLLLGLCSLALLSIFGVFESKPPASEPAELEPERAQIESFERPRLVGNGSSRRIEVARDQASPHPATNAARPSRVARHVPRPLATRASRPEPAEIEIPDAFPLAEWQWHDADADDWGLEPFTEEDPFVLEPEALDDPWGGEWTDRGGGV